MRFANNQLTSIDVSTNTALISLECNSNLLTALDLSVNTGLRLLWCHNNKISVLDVSNSAHLQNFMCYSNLISSLDVSTNTSLESLWCQDNLISFLDVSTNTTLTSFLCYSNQITDLNISNGNNSNMATMYAQNNPNLFCIQVDDISNTPPIGQTWYKDDTANYSNSCAAPPPSVPLNNWSIAFVILLMIFMLWKKKQFIYR